MVNYEKFRQTILQVISTSGLDVGVVLYILKDVVHEIEILYNQKVQEEYKKEKDNLDSESESQNQE